LLTRRIFSHQEFLKKQTKIDNSFIHLPYNCALQEDSLTATAVTGLVVGNRKGKSEDWKGKARENVICERDLDAAAREGSKTAGEEEGSFKIFQPGMHMYR